MRSERRRRAIGRRAGRGDARRSAARQTSGERLTVDRMLALPALDRTLGRLLAHPRALQAVGIAIGVLMVALTLRPLIVPSVPLEAAAPPSPPSTSAAAGAAPDADHDAVLGVVAAYNQASITAALRNTAAPMAPYLAPEGPAWAAVEAEYRRRAARGETHDPALTRWGVLRIAVTGDTAAVETQEQWDDITRVGGAVVSSQRGILTRATYDLRRAPGAASWRITVVTSTTIVG